MSTWCKYRVCKGVQAGFVKALVIKAVWFQVSVRRAFSVFQFIAAFFNCWHLQLYKYTCTVYMYALASGLGQWNSQKNVYHPDDRYANRLNEAIF